jgi:chromate transporter
MKRLWKLSRMGFALGTTVFGGVTAAYPHIREQALAEGWLTGEEVDGLYAFSVVLPGPSFLNLWGAVGARVAGPLGALTAQVALVLPAFILAVALPLTAQIPWVGAHAAGAMNGAIWATAGLLVATGIEGLRKQKQALLWVVSGVALALLLAGVNPLALLVLALGWGALWLR